MIENDEKDLNTLKAIEKTIKIVVERSKTRSIVIAEHILKETKAPAETIREAIRLHYLRKVGRQYYESTLISWEPIHYRNILNGVRTRHSIYNLHWGEKHSKKNVKPVLTTIPDEESIIEKEILDAIHALKKHGCTGQINIHIKL